jgi:hypothetical protein
MVEYVEELNYKITENNYIKELQELFRDSELVTSINKNESLFSLSCILKKIFRDHDVKIGVYIEFDKKVLYRIKLNLEPMESDDTTNYEMDLKLFYFEEIKSHLLDSINKPKDKFKLRVYKIIYNTTPIYGYYETNGSNKISFHTLNKIEKSEPLTEHIICFDIEVMERSFERAKSLANNVISDFCGYLSVLLDIGFHEPTSKYVNFIRTDYIGVDKVFKHERYRTSFYDQELKLYVKDNMNGLCTLEDVKKGNFNNGYYSISSYDGVNTVQMKMGTISSIEKAFASHRLYKVKDMVKGSEDNAHEKVDEINVEPHFLNQPIDIPHELRKYIRGIEQYKKNHYEQFLFFRAACRLYNKSKVLSMEGASMEVSFLVACIETLSKTEENQSFSAFAMKFNKEANKDDLDLLYGIRSKLFHAGSFSFFEYEFDINPNSNPLYLEFRQKYVMFKSILRKTFVNWVKENIIVDLE